MAEDVAQTNERLAVEIIGMHKWYGEFHVLKNINLEVKPGERIVVCGPSGSGKSTLLRCMNMLEEPTHGRVWFDAPGFRLRLPPRSRSRPSFPVLRESSSTPPHRASRGWCS